MVAGANKIKCSEGTCKAKGLCKRAEDKGKKAFGLKVGAGGGVGLLVVRDISQLLCPFRSPSAIISTFSIE